MAAGGERRRRPPVRAAPRGAGAAGSQEGAHGGNLRQTPKLRPWASERGGGFEAAARVAEARPACHLPNFAAAPSEARTGGGAGGGSSMENSPPVFDKPMKSARYIFVFVILGLIMFLILPSFLFQWMEGWTYHEAVYYTFITLSTIGFGDYLIGRRHDRTYIPGYRMIASIWIVMGLAWITVLFELVSKLLAPEDRNASSQKESRGQN